MRAGSISPQMRNGEARMVLDLTLGQTEMQAAPLASDGSLTLDVLETMIHRELPSLQTSATVRQIAEILMIQYNAFQMTNAAGKEAELGLSTDEATRFLAQAGMTPASSPGTWSHAMAVLKL